MATIIDQSFKMILPVMKFTGIYPPEHKSRLHTVRTYVMYFSSLVLITTLTAIKLWHQKNFDVMQLTFVADTGGFALKIFPFLKHDDRMTKCINYFKNLRFAHKSPFEKKIVEECIWICRRNSAVYLIGMIVTIIIWSLTNVLRHKLILEAWLPYDPEANELVYYITTAFLFIALTYDALVGALLDPLIGGLAYHATGQLKILKHNLQNLDRRVSDQSEVKFECLYSFLKECSDHHNAILSFVAEYEECFSFSIFWQFAGSMFSLCFCLMGLLTVGETSGMELAKNAAVLGILIFEILFYCYYGTLLFDENDGLINGIYLGPWYKYDVKIRKVLILMMERSKVPMIITAGKVVNVTLQTFVSVLKTSYSLIAVFNNVQ